MQKDFLKQEIFAQFKKISNIEFLPHLSSGSPRYPRVIYTGSPSRSLSESISSQFLKKVFPKDIHAISVEDE